MKRILIITYYWIPSGGAGVQRWIKFTKYLRYFGYEPVIYTPENPEYPSIDNSFIKDIPENIEIIKTPIWEPYNIYRNLTGKKGQTINAGFISETKKNGWKDKLSIQIRGNFLIPDPRRFWISPSIKYLTEYLNFNPVDVIITTGPPHSMHLIGLGLKKKFPKIQWLADFRDPWTNIDFYKELKVNPISDYIHHKLEKKIVHSADSMIVVSNGMKEEFEAMSPKKLAVIPNGYDEDDITVSTKSLDKKFSISHIGTLNAARNPATVWKVLGILCNEDENFRADLQIQLVGKVDFSVLENIEQEGLTINLEKIDYLPHNKAIEKQQTAQVLMLLINNSENAKGILTGKFFEYLAAKRPILGIGPSDGDAAGVLKETEAGRMVDFDDEVTTRETILHMYHQYKTGKLTINSAGIEQFSRKSLTGKLVEHIDSLCKK